MVVNHLEPSTSGFESWLFWQDLTQVAYMFLGFQEAGGGGGGNNSYLPGLLGELEKTRWAFTFAQYLTRAQ